MTFTTYKSNSLGTNPVKDKVDGLFLQLFNEKRLDAWLKGMINLFNQNLYGPNTPNPFTQWSKEQLSKGLNFFAAPQSTHLINTIFFYKFFPEQMYEESVHPEKLISLAARLQFLHQMILKLRAQLACIVLAHNLSLPTDQLILHKNLPKGIKINFNKDYINYILAAIKELKSIDLGESSYISTVDDLLQAYQYRFNPARLIDASMCIKQNRAFTQEEKFGMFDKAAFFELFQHLTTSQCLDLYGYFANKDTSLLLTSMRSVILAPHRYSWLPSLNPHQLNTLIEVIDTLKSIMKGVRIELQRRNIQSTPYKSEVDAGLPTDSSSSIQPLKKINKKNSEAIIRIIQLYHLTCASKSESLHQQLKNLEEALKAEDY